MDQDYNGPKEPREFDLQDGLALALSYLEDPSDVPCPHCGPGTIEVVCFLDAPSVETGNAVPTEPEGDYTVVLYCHNCGRAAALDLTRDQQGGAGDGIDALDADAFDDDPADPFGDDLDEFTDEVGDPFTDEFIDLGEPLDEGMDGPAGGAADGPGGGAGDDPAEDRDDDSGDPDSDADRGFDNAA